MSLTEKAKNLIILAKEATPGPWRIGYDDNSGKYSEEEEKFCLTTVTKKKVQHPDMSTECVFHAKLCENEGDPEFIAASDPTTVTEICEAYLALTDPSDGRCMEIGALRERNKELEAQLGGVLALEMKSGAQIARMQDLEAANAALLARKCSHGDYKHWGTDGCKSCEVGRITLYILEDECLDCLAKAGVK